MFLNKYASLAHLFIQCKKSATEWSDMDKAEVELLPINRDLVNTVDEYENPVYDSTIQLPIRPPTGPLSKIFTSKVYNRTMSTICFILFVIGFFWSFYKNGSIDATKIQSYVDLLFFEPGEKPRCERMSRDQIYNFLTFLQNSTTCPYKVGDSMWPYCDRAIPFTAKIYTCCENEQFKSLKIGSIDLDNNNVQFLMNALKRVF